MRSLVFLSVQVVTLSLLGVMAGFFFAFAIDVVPAMAQLEASDYVRAQQLVNSVVRNLAFGLTYFGSAVFPFLTALAAVWAGRRRLAIGWLLLAVVYFGAVFWVTRTVNVPINNELATWNASAPPAQWQQARDSWNESNVIRTVASMLCFVGGLLLLALPASRRSET